MLGNVEEKVKRMISRKLDGPGYSGNERTMGDLKEEVGGYIVMEKICLCDQKEAENN